MASKKAKATLFGAVLFCSLTIFAVHFQQHQERDVRLLFCFSWFTYSHIHIDSRRNSQCTKVYWGMMNVDAKKWSKENKISSRPSRNANCMNVCKTSRGLLQHDPNMFAYYLLGCIVSLSTAMLSDDWLSNVMQICVNTVALDLSCLVLLRAVLRSASSIFPWFSLDSSRNGNLSGSSLAI